MFEGIPAWKKNLIKQKMSTRAAQEATKMEEERSRQEKLAEIAAMPEWKRKLFIEKNPQYKS